MVIVMVSEFYEEQIRVAKTQHTIVMIATTLSIFVWFFLAINFMFGCWLYVTLNPSNVMTILNRLKSYFYVAGILFIIHGIIQTATPAVIYLTRRWSGISSFLLLVITLLFIVALILCIYGGIMIIKKLPELEAGCREAFDVYSVDPDRAKSLLREVKGNYSRGALKYVQIGLWIYFVGYVMAMWGIVDFRGARNVCIGFLLIGIGHLLLLMLVPVFNMIPIIGYILWFLGSGDIEKTVIEKYGEAI